MRISIRLDSAAAKAQLRRWGGEFRAKAHKAVARGISMSTRTPAVSATRIGAAAGRKVMVLVPP